MQCMQSPGNALNYVRMNAFRQVAIWKDNIKLSTEKVNVAKIRLAVLIRICRGICIIFANMPASKTSADFIHIG